MADTIEKVYCTGDGGNDNLAAALLARGRDNDPATMLATNNEIISKGTTLGDILYLANMAYADFYPKVIKTESDCVQYAIAVASDPDGYEGMAFCRWTADIIGNGVTIDWEKLE